MRENRTYGSEGGATQLNALFLPLSMVHVRNPRLNGVSDLSGHDAIPKENLTRQWCSSNFPAS
jgi:hypothetical protein